MPFDPADLALSLIPAAFDMTYGRAQRKRERKKSVRNVYATEKADIQKEVSSFLSDANFRTLASGGREGSLAPSINQLATKRLEDLRQKRQRELEEI